MKKEEVLDKAKQLVSNDRVKHYGTPMENFTRIAKMWTILLEHYLKKPISPQMVALCMTAVKQTRLIQTEDHEDSWIDMAGYAACGGEVVCGKPPIGQGSDLPKIHDITHLSTQKPIYHNMMKPKDVPVPAMFGGMKDE